MVVAEGYNNSSSSQCFVQMISKAPDHSLTLLDEIHFGHLLHFHLDEFDKKGVFLT